MQPPQLQLPRKSLVKGGGGGDRSSYWKAGVPGGGPSGANGVGAPAAPAAQPARPAFSHEAPGGVAFECSGFGAAAASSPRGGLGDGPTTSVGDGMWRAVARHPPPEPQFVFKPGADGKLKAIKSPVK